MKKNETVRFSSTANENQLGVVARSNVIQKDVAFPISITFPVGFARSPPLGS